MGEIIDLAEQRRLHALARRVSGLSAGIDATRAKLGSGEISPDRAQAELDVMIAELLTIRRRLGQERAA